MSKLELRGIIVSSAWDMDYLAKYVEKGIIIPESKFRSLLKACSPNEDIDLYVNSPGGSVFAGNEMVNALIQWKLETKKAVNITVGSMACSMAAVMLVTAADKVRVHKNSKIMFHGCFSGVEGGEQAMRDEADLLGKINADIKTQLVSKYDLTPETVETWFAEGRAGWLNAEEAKKIGLACEIIGSDAEKLNVPKNVMNYTQERGLKLAACLTDEITIENNEENTMKILELLQNKGLSANADEKAIESFISGLKSTSDTDNAYAEGLNAGKLEATAKVKDEVKAEITSLNAVIANKDAEITGLKALVDQAKAEKAEAQAKAEKVMAGFGAPVDAKNDKSSKHPFFLAVDAKTETGMEIGAAMIEVQKEQPELFKSMLSESNKKRK